MSRRKLIVFALLAIVLAVGGSLLLLLGADLYLHHRAERSAGLNRWGYRGPVLPRKQAGEVRFVMLGGSTTFGYGVSWDEAIPAQVEKLLHERAEGRRFRTVNLGFNNEGAFASPPTLQDYAWLDYDVVGLYHGYNDMMGDAAHNNAVFRRDSPVFRVFGYYPILPLALQEKAMALRTGGNLDAAYRAARDGGAPKVTFRPNMAERTSATALEAISNATLALGAQLDRVASKTVATATTSEAGCRSPWTHYCDSIYRTVKYARGRGAGVMVIAQPSGRGGPIWGRHEDQRAQTQAMLARHFGSDRGVVFVDASSTVDPTNRELAFDGMHLGPEGNRRVAQALVEPLLALARALGL
jgi:hypothetical protein